MTTWQDLSGLNPQISNPNLIYPGQSILLPDGSSHTVVPGDNLSRIANKFDKNQIERDINPSANTAADAVNDVEGFPDPETQDTGTASGGDELTDEERVLASIGDDQAGPGERSSDPVPVPDDEQEQADPETNEDSEEYTPQQEENLQVGGNNAKRIITNNNPLADYASYTYNFSWHVLTKQDYHNMSTGQPWRPSRNLVSGANRYGEKFTRQAAGSGTYRDPAFMDDFYFSDFKLQTVIGLNSNTRGTNAIDISFTIIEPYGMTLMDRILDINVNELGAKNYLDNPYLIELNFFGINENTGEMGLIPDQTKWFPIKLTGIKIKASTSGSEYSITAVPFNHQAQFESVQGIKTRMEVTASTVGEYFDTNVQATEATKAADATREYNEYYDPEKERQRQSVIGSFEEQAAYDAENPKPPPKPPASVKTKSFAAAYNAWNLAEQKNGNVGYADQIFFVIDPEIRDSKIVEPKKNSIRNVPATSATEQSRSEKGAASADFTATIHSLDAGTKVQDIINLVMPNSEFFRKQITDPATESKNKKDTQCDVDKLNDGSKPFYMYKVIPHITLGDYDKERNIWGKSITFYIQKYLAYNNRDHRVPKSLPPKAVKHYDYFYTGHNTDVIGFDIEFNALYYTAVNVDKGKVGATAGATAQDDTKKNKDAPDTQCANVIDPHMTKPVSQTQQTSAGGVLDNSDTVNAASVMQSFYTSAAGDMISIKLQIIGDPEFIKQDDIFVTPAITGLNPNDQYVGSTGSLAMDNGEIYCYLTFKTPVDFDDTTGLLRTEGKYTVSNFSGYYRVLTVDSEFRGGKFTQTLDLVRYPNQNPALTNEHSGKGSNTRETEDDVTDPNVSKNDVDPAIGEYPEEPEQPDTEAEEDTTTDPDVEETQDEPIVDTEYSDVADNGETLSIDEATSADGNTVPIQNAPDIATEKDYLIKPGDNLTKIAKQNSTTVDYLMLINPQIKNPNLIYAGQTMKVPAI